MFNQTMGTAMGTRFASLFVNFSIEFLEQTVLFHLNYRNIFFLYQFKLIVELFSSIAYFFGAECFEICFKQLTSNYKRQRRTRKV